MAARREPRSCARCQGSLALDNADRLCTACRKKAADDLIRPPGVPRAFWVHDHMRAALDSWHFGRVLSAYRTHPFHGRVLSQESVAGWLSLTQAQLSRIENGRPPEELSKLIHWATVLGVPSDLLWFKLPADKPRGISATTVEQRHERRSSLVEPSVAVPSGLGVLTALAGTQLPGTARATTLAPVTAFEGLSLAQSATQLLTLFLQLDAQLGGDVLYLPLSQYVARMAVAVEANPSDGLLAFGQLCQMAGWLALDANRHGAARRYLTTAVYVGHEQEDFGLAASATAYMSLHATYRGELGAALALARTARATDETALTPLTRAMLATREARAHASLGNTNECLRALDDMRKSFDRNGADEEPVWLSYVDSVEIAAQEGACHLALGRADEAKTALNRALLLLDEHAPHRIRDRVHYLSRLAKTHLLEAEVEQACHIAVEALSLSGTIGSPRVVDRLGEFREALVPYANARSAREFEERYALASHKATP